MPEQLPGRKAASRERSKGEAYSHGADRAPSDNGFEHGKGTKGAKTTAPEGRVGGKEQVDPGTEGEQSEGSSEKAPPESDVAGPLAHEKTEC